MKVLIATDGSEFSKEAIKKCCQIIGNTEDLTIKIISVYQLVMPTNFYGASMASVEEIERSGQLVAEGNIKEAIAIVKENLPNLATEIETEVPRGAADQEIIQVAKDWNADLIAVGSHGRGFWGRLTLGSVSNSLSNNSPCSVLIIRK